ncbi:MAG TPA: thiamine pyrophosphate-dependent dehydrogenase E1 component subunit alpha [Terriglobales bacterium]|nr:thiamine pyrophosphate-dependent dehydrogenase E1 component subunit alpha [Terriglobales bacterium]
MADHDQLTRWVADSTSSASTTRRTLLKGFAAAGAAVSLSSKVAWADGEIGYWAKDLPPEKLVDMYSTILRIRWFERTLADKQLSDRSFRNLIHLYAGQEAVATGVCAALNNKGPFEQLDVIFGTHRPTGHALAKGVDMKKLAAEYNFKATGLNRGYAGEMHLSDKSVGYIGADGIVGPAAVLAAGSAFAFRARGNKQVAVAFGGDGTYATPAFHSSLNNAALLKLPFIYVVENNLYHQFAHYSYSTPMKDIATAANTYRIPGIVVDGQDVMEVYNKTKDAVERARAGEGPTLIEAKTYRYYGHWGAPGAKVGEIGSFGYDPQAITSWRPEREMRAWLARDPVDICRNTLVSWGVIDQAKAAAIEAAMKEEVKEAFEWEAKQPLCKPEDALKHVFVDGTVAARQFG